MKIALALLTLVTLCVPFLFAADEGKSIDWEKGGNPKGESRSDQSTTKPVAASDLPRVLLIGDSISIGYTGPAKAFLKDKAEVVHPRGNCQDSGTGVKNIQVWLGDPAKEKWDVIHFNFGIWDTHFLTNKGDGLVGDETKVNLDEVHIRATPERYRENLKKIIAVLKRTGAKLIWASTTPIMYRKGARFETIVKYNEVAAALMKEEGIEVEDLYSYVLPEVDKWQGNDKVHFGPSGNAALGDKVGKTILAALEGQKNRAPATQPR